MVISAKGCGVHLDVLAPPGDHQVGHDAIEVVEQAVVELIPLWVGIALEHVVAHHGIILADAVQIVIAHQRRMAVVDGPQQVDGLFEATVVEDLCGLLDGFFKFHRHCFSSIYIMYVRDLILYIIITISYVQVVGLRYLRSLP